MYTNSKYFNSAQLNVHTDALKFAYFKHSGQKILYVFSNVFTGNGETEREMETLSGG